ncbi:MAG: pyrroline-5-carboxylate reductase [Clostridia bacterium]|nr:pyrroline-5-carboxylate reductase [Clostridia bacterium]
MKKIGFIGLGNMGSAILNGILSKQTFPPEQIAVSRKHPELAEKYAENGVRIYTGNRELAAEADLIILAVKPNILESVLSEIRDVLDKQLILSIAAGWTPTRLSAALPAGVSYISAMPNVPAAVGSGCTIINEDGRYTDAQMIQAEQIFGAIGTTHRVSGRIFDVCGTLTGCGPAFVFEFMEALCDAAVLEGVPKPLAQSLAAEMIGGAARMVESSGKHPCVLKDAVCSPGGTTIEGVRALHEHGFHVGVMDAIIRAYEKGKKL